MAHGYPDFEGDKSKVFTISDWSAIEGIDKSFDESAVNQGWLDSDLIQYAVPAGKTLYIVGAAFAIQPSAAVDFDSFLYVRGLIQAVEIGGGAFQISGLGGCFLPLTRPLVIAGGVTFEAYVVNCSNIDCDIFVSAWGYEI